MDKYSNSININGQEIAPGEQTTIRLNVGRLPSDTMLNVQLEVFNSDNPGPTMLILAGVHGDEINGVEIVRRSIAKGVFSKLTAGAVVAVPLLNIYGFINFSREVPDGKDVNRSYPGNMLGSLASRVARLITKKVLPSIHFIVDFHTGGASRYNYPQIRITKGDKKSLELAKYFNPPFIIYKPIISGSLRKIAKAKNMPILIYEGGEALRLDGFAINKAIIGLQRLMAQYGMVEETISFPQRTMLVHATNWVRASYSGIFTWTKSSGAKAVKGEPIGYIYDINGTKEISVVATKSGFIIGHNNAPVVNQGDALFSIGYEYEEVTFEEDTRSSI